MLSQFQKLLSLGGGYPALIVAAALLDVGRDVARSLAERDTVDLQDGLNYLLLVEWFVILVSSRRVDWSRIRASWIERGLGLALSVSGLAVAILFPLGPGFGWVRMLICGQIAAKLAFQPGARWLAVAIAIMSVQHLLKHLAPLHFASAHLDALSVHWLLSAAGYPNVQNGATVAVNTFAILILEGCATSYVASQVVSAFLVFALCWGTGPRGIAWGLALTLAGTWIVNMLRLSLMVQSRDAFFYWHYGTGASFVSLALAALAYLAASIFAPRQSSPPAQILKQPDCA